MQNTHDVPQADARFLVYWQQAGNQLFAFTTTISAPSPKAARTSARHRVPRNGRILGVKQ